jgi:hypothetical protein
MKDSKFAYREILWEGKGTLGSVKWVDNIGLDIRKMGCGEWIWLTVVASGRLSCWRC